MGTDPARPATTRSDRSHTTEADARRARDGAMAPEYLVEEATAALWTLFEDAYSHEAARTAQAGVARCDKMVLTPTERHYELQGGHGERCRIAVSLMISVMDGHVHGGAFINTSRPYLSLFIAPVDGGGRLGWRVGTSGRLLTAGIVEDLFLSVLDDDAEATRRLASLVPYSLG